MAKKLTIPQRQTVKTVATEYFMKGYSTRRIAAAVSEETGISISHMTAHVLMNEVTAELKEKYEKRVDELFWLELNKYNNLEAEMWDAWELSKKDRKKTSTRRKGRPLVDPDDPKKIKSVKTLEVHDQEELLEGRGDPRFAAIILDCINNRMEWLGKLKFETESATPPVVNNTNNNIQIVVQAAPRLSKKLQEYYGLNSVEVTPEESNK